MVKAEGNPIQQARPADIPFQNLRENPPEVYQRDVRPIDQNGADTFHNRERHKARRGKWRRTYSSS